VMPAAGVISMARRMSSGRCDKDASRAESFEHRRPVRRDRTGAVERRLSPTNRE
jgi:hypothetical protein